MARIKTDKMSENAQKRASQRVTAQDVAKALNLDARVIYVIENYTQVELTELYTAYNAHIETLGKTAETRAKIAQLEALVAMAESVGMVEAAADARKQLSELAGGQVELLVNELASKQKNKKTKAKADSEALTSLAIA